MKKFWFPKLTEKSNNIKSNSWFDILNYKNKNYTNNNLFIDTNTDLITRSVKILIYPTDKQKKILKLWFDDYIDMYNKTNQYIDSVVFNNDNKIITKNKKLINFYDIRDHKLKEFKLNLSEQNKINKHILDQAIKHNVEMYKSALSNLKNKNIKEFRIRDLIKTKRRKNLIIEPDLISSKKNGFCVSVLKEMKCENNYDLRKIKKTIKLQYDKHLNKYYLLIPQEITKVDNKINEHIQNNNINKINNNINNRIKIKKACGLDPGIRTFATIYGEDNVYQVGNNCKEMLKHYYKQIDKITSRKDKNEISNKKYKKAMNRIYGKIENKVKDLHWKLSNILCKKYSEIFIGKLSTKNIVKNEKSNIHEITKRELYSISHYKFREKLKIQCEKFNCIYKEINEYETTKRCSQCTEINDIGDKKRYKCLNCKIKLDRDINASINIYKKGLPIATMGK